MVSETGVNVLDDLVFGEFYHFFARDRGEALCGSCIKEAEKIIDLRNSADGRAGISSRGFLFYAYHRTQTCDTIYIGSFHFSNKLSGIAGQGFHKSSLSFCVDGIEGERAFPRSANTG